MATKDSTFSISGVVRSPKGELKIKFANDFIRVQKLAKDGNTDIRMFDLGSPMLKLNCVLELRNIDELQDQPTRALIDGFLTKNGVNVAKLPEPKFETTDEVTDEVIDEVTDEVIDEQDEVIAEQQDEVTDEVITELPDFGDIDFDITELPEAAQAVSREIEYA